MKKIINWIFGSFFRQLGRVLAFILVGYLIASLLTYKDIKIPSFLNVNAEELVVPVNFVREEQHTINYNNSPGFEQSTSNSLISQRLIWSTTEANIKEYHITFDTNNKNYENISYIEIPFTFSQPLSFVEGNTNTDTLKLTEKPSVHCKEWKQNTDGNWECFIAENVIASGTIKDYEYVYKDYALDKFNFYVQMVYSDDSWNTCSLNSSSNIVCNPNGKVPKQLYFYINFKTSDATTFLLAISRAFRLYSSATKEQIDSINNIKDKLDDTKNTITSNSDDDESESCGIICKLKSIVKFLKPDSLKNIIVPNEEQMQDLIDTMQTQVTSKLGILAFPVTLYTQIINLVQNTSESSYCFSWDSVTVPNFEDYTIIDSGQYCFSDMLQNQKISSFRTACMLIIGALILLGFTSYLKNCYNKVLDIPDRDEYTYFTAENVYSVDANGEAELTQVRNRSTYREKR